jgi:hypothetical protein
MVVGVGEAIGPDVQSRFELSLRLGWTLVLGGVPGGGWPGRARSSTFSNDVSPESFGQQGADRGVGQRGELDLHGCAVSGEGLFDLLERGCGRHAIQAQPPDLVQRRALFGKASYAAGNGDHEARAAHRAMVGGFVALGDELRLGPLDALSQGGVAKRGVIGRCS